MIIARAEEIEDHSHPSSTQILQVMEKIQLRRGLKHPRHVLKIRWLHILSILFPYFLHVTWSLGFFINQLRNIGQSLLLIIILTILIHL